MAGSRVRIKGVVVRGFLQEVLVRPQGLLLTVPLQAGRVLIPVISPHALPVQDLTIGEQRGLS